MDPLNLVASAAANEMVTKSPGVEARVKPLATYWFRGIKYKSLPARLTISIYVRSQEIKNFLCVLRSELWLVPKAAECLIEMR